MRYAVLRLSDGYVENVAEVEDGDTSEDAPGYRRIQSDIASLGDSRDGTKFIIVPRSNRDQNTI
jgi:hypothetical protein